MKYGRDVLVAIVAALITAISTIWAGSYGPFKDSQSRAFETVIKRVSELEQNIKDQSKQNQILREQVINLTVKLAEKYESSDVLIDYLDDMPHPAWIKIVDDPGSANPLITMWHINDAYESEHDVTREYYIGKTDLTVWPKDVAMQFRENDLAVLYRRSSKCTKETYPIKTNGGNKVVVTRTVCKWTFPLNGSVGIAGISFITD